MNETQTYWSVQLHDRLIARITAQNNLKFFEEKLGYVNSTVIDFRKYIKIYDDSFREAQEEFEKCGGVDYCLKQIDYS